MANMINKLPLLSFVLMSIVTAQQQCYFGPGAENRGPAELVPCMGSGQSACCLLGDTCLSGNTCYNFETGDLYQYGCTDIAYEDPSCPYKCGWSTDNSPWTALEFCQDTPNATDTWVCHAPESCGCDWDYTVDLLVLQRRGCKEMGMDARVALWAPSVLAPYVSLPSTIGGSTGYYSATVSKGVSTWVETAISGYTPSQVAELTTYGPQPTKAVQINANLQPSSATVGAAQPVAVASEGSSVLILSAISSTSTTSPDSASSTDSISTSSVANHSTSSDDTSNTGMSSSINLDASMISISTSTTTSAATLPPTLHPTSSPSTLTIGDKAGIGGGIAGGFCLLLALAILILLRRRHTKSTSDSNPKDSLPSTALQGQASPYQYGEKAQCQTSFPFGPPMISPQYDAQRPGFYHGHSATYSDPRDDASYITGPESPPSELPGGHAIHEIGASGIAEKQC